MNTKHTPGPWTYSRWDEHGDTRFYIAQQEGAPFTPDFSDVATVICETVRIEHVAIQEANARLIAAAPELLEQLQRLCDVIEDRDGSKTAAPVLKEAFAVIAKAREGAQS